jgi:hypothetical protein
VLGFFGRRLSEARERYRSFVAEGAVQGKREDLTGGGLLRSAVGYRLDSVETRRNISRQISSELKKKAKGLPNNSFFGESTPVATLRPRSRTSCGTIMGLSPNLATWIRDDGRCRLMRDTPDNRNDEVQGSPKVRDLPTKVNS